MTFGPPDVPPHWSLYLGIVLAGLGAGMVLFAKELTESKHGAHLKTAGHAVAPEAVKP